MHGHSLFSLYLLNTCILTRSQEWDRGSSLPNSLTGVQRDWKRQAGFGGQHSSSFAPAWSWNKQVTQQQMEQTAPHVCVCVHAGTRHTRRCVPSQMPTCLSQGGCCSVMAFVSCFSHSSLGAWASVGRGHRASVWGLPLCMCVGESEFTCARFSPGVLVSL